MEDKYFLHRIQKEGENYSKGIEIYDDRNAAILSFWGRMKLAYGGNPSITFMSCKITDINGHVIDQRYNQSWHADNAIEDVYFMHYIRKDGANFTKGIDICNTFNEARTSYAAQMEYGYNNPKQSTVKLVSCQITNWDGEIMYPFEETWKATEQEGE